MEKRVLLTGAAGFIGRHTIPFMLEKGYEVHAVDYITQPFFKQNPCLFWHQCDLLNASEQKKLLAKVKPTHLLHFAWYTTPGKYWSSPENFKWIQASLELVMNFINEKGKRAVFAGTCAEYDWSFDYYSEDSTPTHPTTVYGRSKNSLQEMLRYLSLQTKLSSAWGRVFFVYGPYEHPKRFVPTIIRSLLKREPVYCYHGEQLRDFLFVEDVASAFVAILESNVQGTINIGSGQSVALKTITEMIANYLQHSELIKYGNVSASSNEPLLLVANVNKLMQEVGWAMKYPLKTGLKVTIEWWQSNMANLKKTE